MSLQPPTKESNLDTGLLCTCGVDIQPIEETAVAQRDALAASLRAVLRLVDRKAHMWHVDQQIVNGAEALLAEVEGT